MTQGGRDSAAAWQVLRRDKRSALVVFLVIVAGLASLLAVLGVLLHTSRPGDRASPIYWALMLPFAWWAASLANYTPWAVRVLRPACGVSVVASLIALVAAARQTAELVPWFLAMAVACSCGVTGFFLFSGSLLAARGR